MNADVTPMNANRSCAGVKFPCRKLRPEKSDFYWKFYME